MNPDRQWFGFAGPRPDDCFMHKNVLRDFDMIIDMDIPPKTSNTLSPQLPVLPSVQGSRRGGCSVSSDIPEPLDFLIEGESRKKSETDISLDTSEQVPEKTQEEVQTSLFVYVTCVRSLAKCRELSTSASNTSHDHYLCNLACAKSKNMKEKEKSSGKRN